MGDQKDTKYFDSLSNWPQDASKALKLVFHYAYNEQQINPETCENKQLKYNILAAYCNILLILNNNFLPIVVDIGFGDVTLQPFMALFLYYCQNEWTSWAFK